ncbi:phosphotransferase [Paenibacillus sp. SC116]|uniref:phosphotransferase n=1 Tax=Paenibacillus sp. SC116 TaxID=2968986 RepID=UPI00215B4D39|nr:phosphotransferase [Paenibacillus sp. SC116]MCR8844551.1 phosphotransferase [Paenibacillus sp. SC116]
MNHFDDRQQVGCFHDQRMPRLYFEYKRQYYEGHMSHYWNDGFRLITYQHDLYIQPGDELSRIGLYEYEMDKAVYKLTVTDVSLHVDERSLTITVKLQGAESIDFLHQHIYAVILGNSPLRRFSSSEFTPFPSFIGRKHYTKDATAARQKWLEQFTGNTLTHVTRSLFHEQPSTLAGNIENYIGSIQVPLGIAGPLRIRGTYANGHIPIPIATTEGALISSISRGAKACNAAGGIEVHVLKQTMVRAPVFFCEDMSGAIQLAQWIDKHKASIKAEAERVTSVSKLISLHAHPFADFVHVQFGYETGDAAGQNMTTSCTYVACEWIASKVKYLADLKYVRYMIEGNQAGDKKVAYRSFIGGRGIQVNASIHIPEAILKQTMRISVDQYMKCWYAAEVGALQTGMIGHNVNFANVIAGVFSATGQDMASIHEASCGIFKARPEGGGISFHVQLPSLVIGTVGGGTGLPTQRECLEMMGCYGRGKVYKLAEIIASACLALDLSTSSAIISNEFVKAHERLGRKAEGVGIRRNDIKPRFFQALLGEAYGKVASFELTPLNTESSVITNMLKANNSSFQGLHRYLLHLQTHTSKEDNLRHASTTSLPVVLKVKSNDREVMDLGIGIAKLSGDDRLSGLFESQMHIFGFEGSHVREIAFYQHAPMTLLRYCPHVYGVTCDEDKEVYAILMEDLSPCSHLGTIESLAVWDEEHIDYVLADAAKMHALFLNKADKLPAALQFDRLEESSYEDATELLLALTDYNYARFPTMISSHFYHLLRQFILQLPFHNEQMKQYHQTITHNDFNPRNLGLRPSAGAKHLVVYDWELVRYQNPQHDCVEFLSYTVAANASTQQWDAYIEQYRVYLEQESGVSLDRKNFEQITLLNALELVAVRYNLYLLAHNLLHFSYMETIYQSLSQYIVDKIKDNPSLIELQLSN